MIHVLCKRKIWILQPFQDYFTYFEPIVNHRWAKIRVPREKPPDLLVQNLASHMYPERGSSHRRLEPQCREIQCLGVSALNHWTREACHMFCVISNLQQENETLHLDKIYLRQRQESFNNQITEHYLDELSSLTRL